MSEETTLLVADIGASNARFARACLAPGGGISLHDERRYRCDDFEGVPALLDAYHRDSGLQFSNACMALAGPVESDPVKLTNRGWAVEVEQLRLSRDWRNLFVINDAAAGAFASLALPAQNLEPVRQGQALPEQPRLNLVPGTGFGIGAIIHDRRWIPIQGEGAYATLAAAKLREFKIFQALGQRPIADYLLSGPGMLRLYQGLCLVHRVEAAAIDAPEMTARALEGNDPVCVEALDTYLQLLGRLAGDLALTLNAHGGVYLSGGLLNRLGATRMKQLFNEAFEDKGKNTGKVRRIPVWLNTHDQPALLGAAAYFRELTTS